MQEQLFGPAFIHGDLFAGYPLSGPITSKFGARDIAEHAGGHSGVDIAAPAGTGVLAPAPGVVMDAQASGGVFGSYVLLHHRGGLVSLYAHLSRIDVARGQGVRRGDGLGLVGVTGLTTGPHLHWGVSLGGTPLVTGPHLRDALRYIFAQPAEVDRERLLRAVAASLSGALQAAGAALQTDSDSDFEAYADGSAEQQILAIQRAANPFLGQWAE